jgi:hypothetical protein
MLTTPILFQQVAFDAAFDQTVFFNVIGGNQVVSNNLKILDNDTLAVVYDATQVTFRFEHVIPANTLINGKNYVMQVRTFDASANASLFSNSVQFYCFTSPTMTFTNIPVGNIIENSTFLFDVEYDQNEDELLNTYTFKLYNSASAQIATSDLQYVGSTTPPPTTISYMFGGFEDNSNYFVECVGQTVNGTNVTTGLIAFSVDYVKPNVFAIVGLENICPNGNILISSNIVTIEGKSNPSPPTYIADKEVDLTADGSWVLWDNGFSIDDNFTMRIWGRDFTDYETIVEVWSSALAPATNNIKLIYMVDTYANKVYVELRCSQNGVAPYYIYSNYLDPPLSTEQLFIWVRRVGNLFDLIIENKGVV